MPIRQLLIVGGGEHACVVAEAARTRPDEWSVAGIVDVLPRPETVARLGVPQIGSDAAAAARAGDVWYVLGTARIDAIRLRHRLAELYTMAGARWATIVHARAWVSPSAVLERGAVVLAGAVVNSGASLGAHCVVNSASVIEHDVKIGAFTHAAPGTVIGGGAEIAGDCYLGLGCRVRDHVRIGAEAVVGMGAVVVQDVSAGATVVGTPAKPISHQ